MWSQYGKYTGCSFYVGMKGIEQSLSYHTTKGLRDYGQNSIELYQDTL